MKALYTALFLGILFIAGNSFGQLKLEAPVGLEFGSSLSTVKAKLSSRGKFDNEGKLEYGTSLTFLDVKIGSLTAFLAMTKFVDNKLFEVNFIFESENSNEIQDLYRKISNIIEGKYGIGKSYRDFKYPYSDGDDDMIIAIKNGYADISTYWTNFTNESDAISTEILSISDMLSVSLCYQNGELYEKAQAKVNVIDSSDF